VISESFLLRYERLDDIEYLFGLVGFGNVSRLGIYVKKKYG